jgi:hypothetical protein
MRRRLAASVLCLLLASPLSAADTRACIGSAERTRTLRAILDANWLGIRPDAVRKAWHRPLEEVPTACHSEWGCLFLGNATMLPGPGDRPSAGDCSDGFIFNRESKSGPQILTGVQLDEWSASVAAAQRVAETLSSAVVPPEGACPYLQVPWRAPERGRECQWSADGDKVIVLSIKIIHRRPVWGTQLNVSRMEF